MSDRGQAHMLEAFSAALILLASVVFALQVTAVTPLTASTASQHIENQQAAVGKGVLDAAAENGTLRPTLLYWNNSSGQFHDTSGEVYSNGGPPTRFGETLNETFFEQGIAFNVNVIYVDETGGIGGEKQLVESGASSDNAVTVRRTVTLYDDDHLREADGSKSSLVLGDGTSYFAPDAAPNSSVYNVVQVELVLWRM